MDDEEFWQLVEAKRLNPHIIDTLKVQWAFNRVAGQKRNICVLRVLEFNDSVLAEPLDDNALRAVLGRYEREHSQTKDLFDV